MVCFWAKINSCGTHTINIWVDRGHRLIDALVTQVEIALVQASPKNFLSAQVRQLAGVTKNETVLYLPVCFAFLRIKRMAVGTFHSYMRLIKLFSFRALLELPAFVSQIFHAVVFFLLVIIGYLAISAVDSSFGANL